MSILRKPLRLIPFMIIISLINFLCYHLPFFNFVFNNLEYKSLSGVTLVISLVIAMVIANAFAYYLFYSISIKLGKFLTVLFFIINSFAVYFVLTYGVIIDESMIGNILNTNYEESSSFFSFKLIAYVIVLGILPSIYVIIAKVEKENLKRFSITSGLTLLFLLILVFVNATNWLWIDKNSKTLGGLAMPWSYAVNTSLFYIHKSQKNQKEILLPNATIKNNEKSVVVLVIGESSRKQDYSLYGYQKNTNPLLSKVENLQVYEATSCATYTTAGVKCILEHENSNDLYEILPNYLFRNNVEVVWRTTNSGEPPLHIKNVQNRDYLKAHYGADNSDFDEVLVKGLKEQIVSSKQNKVLIVLHTSTSHGPLYSTRYPAKFEQFKPVCNSVELGNCSKEELLNAYDNTIVYTDFILNSIIDDLKELKDYKSSMIFVSDHGESLGEKNLYMHGVPMSMAPKEQYEIPFIVWSSDQSKGYKPKQALTQNNVFHSVLHFLDIDSPIYNEKMNIYR